jgi:predicted transcriptional regulator
MTRTQIYLTETETAALERLARETGRKKSELIREAVDAYVAKRQAGHRNAVLDRAAGLWAERGELPDARELRKSWERDLA